MFKAVQQPERFLDRPGRPQVEFETWIQLFDAYACVSGLNECPENLRRNTFVLSLGAEGYRICLSRPGPKDTMEDLIDAMA